MTQSEVHTADLQILGTTVQNLVTTVTRHPGFVHPWCLDLYCMNVLLCMFNFLLILLYFTLVLPYVLFKYCSCMFFVSLWVILSRALLFPVHYSSFVIHQMLLSPFNIGFIHLLCSMTSLNSFLHQKYNANQWMTCCCRWKRWILTKLSISLSHHLQILYKLSLRKEDWYFLELWMNRKVKVSSARMDLNCECMCYCLLFPVIFPWHHLSVPEKWISKH